MDEKESILLTALGTQARDGEYGLGGKRVEACLSPVALVKMLDEKPKRVVALCTERAKKGTYPKLEEEMKKLGIECEWILIPEGKDNAEILGIMKNILEKIPEKSKLTLEVTQGLRHLPFLFFAAALYLSSLKDVEIKGVWYGMFEGKIEDKNGSNYAPFVDLRILLEMAEWFQAVKAFRNDRQARALIKLLEEKKESIPKPTCKEESMKNPRSDFENFVKALKNFSIYYGAGLPIELGKEADAISSHITKLKGKNVSGVDIPLFSELIEKIGDAAEPYRFLNPNYKNKWKKGIVLNEKELEREAKLIDEYLENGMYANATGLIREWILSRVIVSLKGDEKITWLDKNEREKIERRLGYLSRMTRNNKTKELLSKEHVWLGEIWDYFGKVRNEIHHNGMRDDEVGLKIEEIKAKWEELKRQSKEEEWWNSRLGGGKGVLLVSPLGLSSGLLYSALVKIPQELNLTPKKVLVISSKDGVKKLDEIKKESNYNGDIKSIVFEDPHAGFNETERIVEESRKYLVDADEIVINVTGGTTAIQHAVNEIAREAANMEKKVQQIALVDRRPVEEQRGKPYVAGELIDLKKSRGNKNEEY